MYGAYRLPLLQAKHENIVRVHEIVIGDTMDDIFIVMDFIEHDLKALLESISQPLLQAEVKCLMIQLLRGVAHLHDNWILHRDLKTSNLLLSHSVSSGKCGPHDTGGTAAHC